MQVGPKGSPARLRVLRAREDAQEGLLGDVGGVLAAPGEPQRHVVEAVLVTPEEDGESLAVAVEGEPAELLVRER